MRGRVVIDEKRRCFSECNGRDAANVSTARSGGYRCIPVSMELQPIFLLGPVLLLHWGAPFQRAVRRDVELVARSWPAGGKRSLRHRLPVNPAWLPDPRLDR